MLIFIRSFAQKSIRQAKYALGEIQSPDRSVFGQGGFLDFLGKISIVKNLMA